MTRTLVERERESGVDSHTLPQHSRLHGPVSTRRQRRTLLVYTVIAVVGFLPSVFGLGAGWQAFGLGLPLPGGGFLLQGGWGVGATVLSLVIFALSMVAWFGTGNVLAPIVTWLLAAGLAAWWSAGDAQPGPAAAIAVAAIVVLGALLAVALKRRAAAKAHRLRAEREAYLPAALAAYHQRRVPDATGVGELDERQLAHLRWLLELGRQPRGQYAGFDVVEQFQPSALRYQINHAQYALAQVQRHYTPNFHGYLSQAQENLIEKLSDRKVWSYWRLERLWGRLSLHYDPAATENIMFTGWSGICLNTYSATTGNARFAGSDALEFTLGNPKKTYRHGAESFNRSLLQNFDQAEHTLFPCEPNWTYSACNLYGINSVASYDAAFGTDHLDAVKEPLLRGLREEFMSPAGDVVPFRADHLGFGPPASGGATLALTSAWAKPVFPLLGETLWAILCREVLKLDTGAINEFLNKPMMTDAGNYKNTGLWSRATMAFAAVEFGELDVAKAVFETMDRANDPVEDNGARRYANGSTFGNAIAAHAALNRPGDWTALITQPPSPTALTGPVLSEVAYDEVMVAHAASTGRDLDLVLYPAPQQVSGVDATLRIERLDPGRGYRVDTPVGVVDVTADAAGHALVTVRVDGRTTVRAQPV